MDRATELTHLRNAEDGIVRAQDRIDRQYELIARLRNHGHDATTANALLQTMRETLAVMHEHREHIMKALSR
jgi:hypothetical protein